jgi:hypothetical protein
MRKTPKKLRLSRETLSKMDGSRLAEAVGALVPVSSGDEPCEYTKGFTCSDYAACTCWCR